MPKPKKHNTPETMKTKEQITNARANVQQKIRIDKVTHMPSGHTSNVMMLPKKSYCNAKPRMRYLALNTLKKCMNLQITAKKFFQFFFSLHSTCSEEDS